MRSGRRRQCGPSSGLAAGSPATGRPRGPARRGRPAPGRAAALWRGEGASASPGTPQSEGRRGRSVARPVDATDREATDGLDIGAGPEREQVPDGADGAGDVVDVDEGPDPPAHLDLAD